MPHTLLLNIKSCGQNWSEKFPDVVSQSLVRKFDLLG